MTKTEIETLKNVIARLKEENCGCSHGHGTEAKIEASGLKTKPSEDGSTINEVAVVSRIYLNTWVIPALEYLLPGELHDPQLARRLSGR